MQGRIQSLAFSLCFFGKGRCMIDDEKNMEQDIKTGRKVVGKWVR